MPSLSEMGFFFGFNVDEQRFDPLEVWSDELLAAHWPEDLTNPLVLQRLAAENSANAAHTLAQAVAAPVAPAAHGPITSEPAMPPADESSVDAAPLTHAPAPALPVLPQLGGDAHGMNWINIALRDYGVVMPTSESAPMIIEQAHIATLGPGFRDSLRFTSNVLHHLLPGEMIRIRREGRFLDKAVIASLRQKVSRIGTTMGATLKLIESHQYIEIGRLN